MNHETRATASWACLLPWPLSSGSGRGPRSRAAVSRRHFARPNAKRLPPPRITPPLAPGRARARPPVAGELPPQVAKPALRPRLRADGHCCRIGRGSPHCRVAERLTDRALLRGRRWHAPDCRVLASDPARRLISSSVRSLGAGSDMACARLGGVSPHWQSGTTRSAPPPSWFDSHHGGLLRAPVSRVLHLEPDLASTAFPRRAPADRPWVSTEVVIQLRPVWDRATAPRRGRLSHPSKNSPPLRSRAEDANLGPAAPRHRGRCPLAVHPGRSSRLPMPPLPGAPLDAPPGPDGGFEALLRRRVRSAAPPLPATRRPILPWALFPFKVHFPPGPVP